MSKSSSSGLGKSHFGAQPAEALWGARQINQRCEKLKPFGGHEYKVLKHVGFHLLNAVSIVSNALSTVASAVIYPSNKFIKKQGWCESARPFKASFMATGRALFRLPLLLEIRTLAGLKWPWLKA